jgi:hypothetical protein
MPKKLGSVRVGHISQDNKLTRIADSTLKGGLDDTRPGRHDKAAAEND